MYPGIDSNMTLLSSSAVVRSQISLAKLIIESVACMLCKCSLTAYDVSESISNSVSYRSSDNSSSIILPTR